jgi:putative ABC transport system ATP-binding protein
MTDGPVVSLEGVCKEYRLGDVQVPALREVSLDIPRCRLAVVIGPSGSGKTTLLNLVGCIDRPNRGTVKVCGTNVATLKDDALSDFRARNIGFIFQTFNLLPVLSAYENVEYPLLLTGAPAAERKARTMDMLEAVGLIDQRSQKPNQLSGGQRQRVAVARALIKHPELVLADEPTANLDSKTGATIIELMRRMQREARTTFVFCSHDRQLIEHAEETFVLSDGALVDHLPGVEERIS